MKKNKNKGFTLIEILVVIGIIAILAAVVLVAINPARQFAQANNSQREANVNAILNAIGQYSSDHKGDLPAGLTVAACPVATPCTITGLSGTAKVDLCPALVTTYLPALPVDPTVTGGSVATCNATYTTGYTAGVDSAGRVTIFAPSTQKPPASADISVTR